VGNSPVGNSPVGNSPVGNSPVGNSPVGNSPVGNSPVGNSRLLVPDERTCAPPARRAWVVGRRHDSGVLLTVSSSLFRKCRIGIFAYFGYCSCPAFGLRRFGHASAWHRFLPCWSSFHAKDRTRKSAAPVQCMARHRRKAAVFPRISRRTCIAAFVADRQVINSTSMRRPHVRACLRRQLICANESDALFPGLRTNESACRPPRSRWRSLSGMRFQLRAERGAVAQDD
jgi:hypothetical protein